MSWSLLPNSLCILRIALVPPTVWALGASHYRTALGLVVLASLTDALDGFLARRFGWDSKVGSILDPLADKIMLVSLFLALGWLGHLPAWLAVLVVLRDLVIVTGAIAYQILIGGLKMEPTVAGKATTGAQLSLLGVVVGRLAGVPLPEGLVVVLIWLAGAVTLWSGIDYVCRWGLRAIAVSRGR